MRHYATHAYTGERLKNRHVAGLFGTVATLPSAKPVEDTAFDQALTAAIDALDTRGGEEPDGEEINAADDCQPHINT